MMPKIPEAYDLICYGYYKAKKYVKACEYGELALATSDSPQAKASIRFNLAKCHQYANNPERAIQLLKLNTISNPEDVDSKIDYCVAIYSKGNKAEAGNMLREMLKNDKLSEKARKIVTFNLGAHDLREGNFKSGMQKLLTGRDLTIWGSNTHKFPIPKWDGTPQQGKKILIIGEGGIGDEILNMRFAENFRKLGMTPSWASAHGLAEFIKKCGWSITDGPYQLGFENLVNYKNFTTDIPTIVNYDLWVPSMDVAALLDVDRDELWNGPYLQRPLLMMAPYQGFKINKELFNQQYEYLGSKRPIRIGIRWSGNPLYEQDLHRTIPVVDIYKMLKETIKVPFELYSFQRDAGLEPLAEMPDVIDLSRNMKTYTDTAWLLSEMDLVISSCTSIAHASAALGVETIVMTPIMAYHTWAEETNKSPWYGDNLTLIRQTKPNSWNESIQELTKYIEKFNK